MSIELSILYTIGLTSWFYLAFSIASKIIRKQVYNDIQKDLQKKGL
jgi:hypothetical protein